MGFANTFEALLKEAKEDGINAIVAYEHGNGIRWFHSLEDYNKVERAVLVAQKYYLKNTIEGEVNVRFYNKMQQLANEARKEGANAIIAYEKDHTFGCFRSEENEDKTYRAMLAAQYMFLRNRNNKEMFKKFEVLLGKEVYQELLERVQNDSTKISDQATMEFKNSIISLIGKEKFEFIWNPSSELRTTTKDFENTVESLKKRQEAIRNL